MVLLRVAAASCCGVVLPDLSLDVLPDWAARRLDPISL